MILREVLDLYENTKSSQSGVKNEKPRKFEGVHKLCESVGKKKNLSFLPER